MLWNKVFNSFNFNDHFSVNQYIRKVLPNLMSIEMNIDGHLFFYESFSSQ